MNKKFTRLETGLLILLTAALLGLFYYQFVYRPLQDARTLYDTTDIDTQIQAYQTKIMKMRDLEQAAEDSRKNNKGYVATYNSQKQEIRELNDIFQDAVSYDFTFDDPVADGDTVRRNFTVTFTAENYDKAKKIMKALYDGKYRCQIGDISFSPVSLGTVTYEDDVTLDISGVTVTMSLTFYETLADARSTKGVTVENQDVDTGNDVLNDLANEKAAYENMGSDY